MGVHDGQVALSSSNAHTSAGGRRDLGADVDVLDCHVPYGTKSVWSLIGAARRYPSSSVGTSGNPGTFRSTVHAIAVTATTATAAIGITGCPR